MIKKLKNLIIAAAASIALVAPIAAPAMVRAADINGGLCQGVSLQVSKAGETCDVAGVGADGTDKVNTLITTVINIFSLVVGVVAVIMIIVGGLKYITSGGDSGNVTGAKNTILYAVIGLVVVALAQFIVKFVLGKATA